MATSDSLWNDRLADILGTDFTDNRQTTFEARAGILDNMINRIGKTIIAGQPNAYNPFGGWTRAVMDFGDTIQRYTLPYIQGRKPDYEPENPNPFGIVKPVPQAQYWTINDGVQYKQTIMNDQIKKAFTNASTFGSFTGEIMNQMYRSVGIDMFLKWKKYLSQDIAPDAGVDTLAYSDDVQYGYELWVKIKDWVTTKMFYPNDQYNKMGFLTSSPSVDVIITSEAKNMMDRALAGVYNVNKVEMTNLNFIQIDSFMETNRGNRDVLILTSGMADYTPRTPESGALYNPENYYTNYWYKEEGLFSIDFAQNACEIYRE